MRASYAENERALEHVYEIRDGRQPRRSEFQGFLTLPSEILIHPFRQSNYYVFNSKYTFIINLDDEVFTMNYSIHWKLGNIPRQDKLWLRAVETSIYRNVPTINPDLCSDEHLVSLALELPESKMEIGYASRTVAPKTSIREGRKAFLTLVLSKVLIAHEKHYAIWE